jgi:isochorismate synthase
MNIEVKEGVIQKLISKNIPFVVFREPGTISKLLVQNSPLKANREIKIEDRGFYAFPFSVKEQSKPIFFAPDILIDYEDRKEIQIPGNAFNVELSYEQKLYEVEEEEYVEDLRAYLNSFEKNNIKKAIYSRISTVELDDDFDVEGFYEKLESNYSKAFVYMMHIPGDGIWIGASPELLLSYEDEVAKTVALAGTLKITENLASPEWTRKEIDEHRLVERHIIGLCKEMGLQYDKSAVRTSNTGKVYHLKSDFTLKISSTEIVSFLEKLHPTPAISGLPQIESLDLIYDIEKHDRSYYCGFLGFVNDVSKFNLFINLRCMKISEGNYTLFAGGGITPDSDIEKEWDETNVKMATLTDLMPHSNVDYKEISSISC